MRLLDGFQRPQDALIRPDRLAAIEWALEHARPGECVVIAGKGETKAAGKSTARRGLGRSPHRP
jgi:UDP-N-acetylmuramyl tripeptide synthase